MNNATETQWFQTLTRPASALCLIRGRVRFWKPEQEHAAPLQGQALVYLGPEPDTFAQCVQATGSVWRPAL